jgi:hypothetical protein
MMTSDGDELKIENSVQHGRESPRKTALLPGIISETANPLVFISQIMKAFYVQFTISLTG